MNKTGYKKILIVGAEVKPIPSVKGGAVEQLVEQIIDRNENKKFADITIISPYDSSALKKSKTYKNTIFLFVNNIQGIKSTIYKFIDSLSRKFFKRSTGLLYIHKVCKLLKSENYDTVLIENRPTFGIHIRKVYKGNLYLHLHNDYINVDTHQLKEIIKSYDKIITISFYLKRRIEETGFTHVNVVYNGININNFVHKTTSINSKKIILYVGRIVKEKGLLELLMAFSSIKNDEIELLLIGEKTKKTYSNRIFIQQFKRLIKKDSRIKHIGYIENNKLSDFYSEAYVGIIPTIIEEGLSLTAIEMITSGLPVIATKSGGLIEVVDNNVGILIERTRLMDNLKNAIQTIVNDYDYRNRLSNNCKNKTNIFSIEKYTEEMIDNLLN